MIQVEGLCKSYDGEAVLHQVDFQVSRGVCYGIIGPNGSGKSTLLRTVTGVEERDAGRVMIDGKPLSSFSRKSLARFMAVLEQDALPPIGFSVREIVEMGRYPHQNWLGREPHRPDGQIDSIMRRLSLEDLSERTADRLSGGERQRVALGKAMAQEPRLLLLDEPTTFLDIGYQLQMMNYVREWQAESGLTVLAVLHDLNLAAQYCDRLLVLKDGCKVAEGNPQEIIREELIEAVYGTRPVIVKHPESGVPQILLKPGSGSASSV